MDIKIVGLTYFNTAALRETLPAGWATVTATTATFHTERIPGNDPVAGLADVMSKLTGRGHPKRSLHAVMRKLKAATQQG